MKIYSTKKKSKTRTRGLPDIALSPAEVVFLYLWINEDLALLWSLVQALGIIVLTTHTKFHTYWHNCNYFFITKSGIISWIGLHAPYQFEWWNVTNVSYNVTHGDSVQYKLFPKWANLKWPYGDSAVSALQHDFASFMNINNIIFCDQCISVFPINTICQCYTACNPSGFCIPVIHLHNFFFVDIV